MQIEEKYQVLEAIAGTGGSQDVTVPAWERASGRLVFIHILAGGYSPETNHILSSISRLPPEHKQHVMGAGDHSGSAYIVTDALPWGASLRAWVASISGQAEQVERPADPARLLHAGAWRIPVLKPEPPPVKASPAEPGEFTGMQGSAPPDTPATTARGGVESLGSSSSAGAPIAGATNEPGNASKIGAKAEPRPVSASPAEPGEFSRIFGIAPPDAPATTARGGPESLGSSSSTGVPVHGATAEPEGASQIAAHAEPRPVSASTGEPGEFTRMFGITPVDAHGAKGPAAPESLGSSSSTGVPVHGATAEPGDASKIGAKAEPRPVSASPGEPGEFTRMFGIAPTDAPATTARGGMESLGSSSSAGVPIPGATAGPGGASQIAAHAEPRPVSKSPAEPGEFTRMFGIASGDAHGATSPAAPGSLGFSSSVDAPTPAAMAEPGEFTRLMQAAQPAGETPVRKTAPPESGPMEVVTPPRDSSAATAALLSNQTEPTRTVAPSEMQAGKVAKPNAPGVPDVAPSQPGEFTRIFGRGQSATLNPEETQEMVIPAPLTPPMPPGAPPPGEFTLLMRGGPPAAAKTPPPAKPEPAPTVESGNAAGTMYVRRHPPMAKPAFPPASGSPEPAAPRATGDPPWRYENAAPQRSTDAPPASGPGEFTRMFHPNVAQSSGSGSVLPPAAKQPAVEGEFTRMMKAPPVASDNLFTPTGAPQPDVFTERPAPIERDDFSRVANAGRETPQQAPASGKVEASPAAKPHASNLPVILIVGGLLLITLVLVVVFAVMR